MANVIKHKRGSGSDPTASDLVVGEVAIRTDVGKLFTKMDNGSVAEIAGGGSDIAINTLSASSYSGGSGASAFNGSENRFTLSSPPNVSAAQLLVSVNGVIQKPVLGTGTPSEGFSVNGSDIIFSSAPETGADFFILTFKSLGVSEPADNSVTSAKIVDGAIVNADINASAAIAGSKINPSFGNQNVITGGNLTVNGGQITINGSTAAVQLVDTGDNPDYRLVNSNGIFKIRDATNTVDRVKVNTDGHVDITGNLDVGAGLDVTGNITATGTLSCTDITSSDGTPSITLNDSANNQFAFIDGNSGNLILHSDKGNTGSSSTMKFGIDNAIKMTLDASGNLDVTGTITSTGDITITDVNPALLLVDSNNNSDYELGNQDGTFRLRDSTNTTNRMTLSSTGQFDFEGNVDCNNGLDVTGDITGTGDLTLSTGDLILSSGQIRATDQIPAIFKHAVTGATACTVLIGNNTHTFAFEASSNGFSINDFTNTNQQRLFIDTSGNVGIGTNSPGQKLDVSGNINTTGGITSSSTGNASLVLDAGTGSQAGNQISFIDFKLDGTLEGNIAVNEATSGKPLEINSATNHDIVMATGGGKVGIGLTTPQSQLELSAANDTITGIQLGRAGDAITASRYIGICQTNNPTNLGVNSGFSGVEFGGPSSSDEAYLAFHTHDAGVGSGERFRIDKTGNVVPADSLNVLSTLRTQGQTFVKLTGHSTSNFSVMVFGVNSGGHNTGSCAVALGKHSTNSRSLNAAGTVNASGNDYAEYMTKSSDFTLAKGDICGIDANGKLTNKFSESISFVVKSTDPSYVGGDAWGTEEILGEKPADDSDDLVAYEEKYEAARKMVDRIAFSGQVPVNVTGTTPGQHIIPSADSGDAITGVAKAEKDLSIAEYMSSIGKVIGLEPDGRAKIIVKVA